MGLFLIDPAMHATAEPSPWLQRWVHLLPAGGRVLDVACGSGRHLRWLAGRGLRMTGIDRDAAALAGLGRPRRPLRCGIDRGRYRERPLALALAASSTRRRHQLPVATAVANNCWASLASGGRAGLRDLCSRQFKPSASRRGPISCSSPASCWTACAGLRIVAYEDGFLDHPDRFRCSGWWRCGPTLAPAPRPATG